MKQVLKRSLALIGPYPYNPLLIFAFFTACYFSRFIPVLVQQPHGVARFATAASMLILALVPSSGFALIAFLIQKYRRWSKTSLIFYIAEVAVGQALLFIYAPFIKRFLAEKYQYEYDAPLTLTVGFFIGSLILGLICLALLHRAELSIIKRLEKADKLTQQLERDREELIFSDEELRKQTSHFLHDRVQSDLMVVAMKLKSIQGKSSPEVDAVIKKAISRLESTRSSDLRNLIQILAPNFESGGLVEALRLLKRQYQSSMVVEIDVIADSEKLRESQRLGIFRIVEQGLLNALVHGPASAVRISLSDGSAGMALEILDNGPGTNLCDITPGVGSAIIDSWVNILKAEKFVSSSPGQGYSLKVVLN